jgi:hypothetical protein
LDIQLPERVPVPAQGRLELSLDDGHEHQIFTATAPRAIGRNEVDWNSSRITLSHVIPGDYTVIIRSVGAPDARNAFRFVREAHIYSETSTTIDLSGE